MSDTNFTGADKLFLQATLALAERGRMTCAPNPCVGCIIVRDGQIIGRGFHQHTGQGHAEVNAITDAGGDIRGATVYVSLEPCAFVGRTPACANTLVESGVARVVMAAYDPHPKVSGAGAKLLEDADIPVHCAGWPEALQLIEGYVLRTLHNRPLVRVKTATSMDGSIASASGESKWITGTAARQDVQYYRARSDAIITGINTVLADDPQLNVRASEWLGAKAPLRVILDSKLRITANLKIVQDGLPTLICHSAHAKVPEFLRDAKHIELCSTANLSGDTRTDSARTDIVSLMKELAERGCNEVLVEAGSRVVGSFLAADMWDEWVAYVAPKWLGAKAQGVAEFSLTQLVDAPQGTVVDVTTVGSDTRITVQRQQADR